MEYWVIDRWEGDLAICQNEQGKRQEVPKHQLPEGLKEGDWLQLLENGSFIFSSEETKKRKENAKKLRKCLFLR